MQMDTNIKQQQFLTISCETVRYNCSKMKYFLGDLPQIL